MIYTVTGGIKATILTDYVHTIIIYVMILTGLFVVYSRSSLIGSPEAMFELLKAAAQRAPVSGNADGEYLTMSSRSGVLLGGKYGPLHRGFLLKRPKLPGSFRLTGDISCLLVCGIWKHSRYPTLPKGHYCESSQHSTGIHDWWIGVVLHSLLPRHHLWPCSTSLGNEPCIPNISSNHDRS